MARAAIESLIGTATAPMEKVAQIVKNKTVEALLDAAAEPIKKDWSWQAIAVTCVALVLGFVVIKAAFSEMLDKLGKLLLRWIVLPILVMFTLFSLNIAMASALLKYGFGVYVPLHYISDDALVTNTSALLPLWLR